MDLFECQTITQIRMNAHGWLKIMLQPREKNARFAHFLGNPELPARRIAIRRGLITRSQGRQWAKQDFSRVCLATPRLTVLLITFNPSALRVQLSKVKEH